MAEIFHIALRPDWDAARADGGPYEISTRGRTRQEVGFIHACRNHDQVDRVRRAFYADLDAGSDLVLLVIDTDKLDAPVRHEPADGDTYPHIYGPLPLDAVIHVRPLHVTR
ncbi:MAG TPA: DUF952 domain-containing protein [Streptosporangiaceae bacterium]|nr:DUF952 domain-containing protein [Streptosporangiaceae bacterium]